MSGDTHGYSGEQGPAQPPRTPARMETLAQVLAVQPGDSVSGTVPCRNGLSYREGFPQEAPVSLPLIPVKNEPVCPGPRSRWAHAEAFLSRSESHSPGAQSNQQCTCDTAKTDIKEREQKTAREKIPVSHFWEYWGKVI